MHSAIVLALAAGALAVPYKRDVVTHVDVVFETDVVTVWANQQTSAVAVEAAAPTTTSTSAIHYGHNHWSNYLTRSSSTSTSSSTTSSSISTAEPTTPTSTYVPPPPPTTTTTSTPAPTTTSQAPPPPPPTTSSTSTWVAPSSSSTWAAPSSSAAAASSAAPAKPTSYQEIVVYHHNIHRANHSAPDLDWSDDLASSSATIAASCIYEHNTTVAGGGYGQNIAAGVEATNISAIITDLFYNGEVNWYEGLYNVPQPDMTNFEHWGHFSQIVWKDTTHVGCATQYCPNGLGNVGSDVSPYFTVCNYKNSGNWANEYGANVGDSLGLPTAAWNAGM